MNTRTKIRNSRQENSHTHEKVTTRKQKNLLRKISNMYLEQKAQFLLVLGFTLVFEGCQCWKREVLVAYGSEAVLPCVDDSSTLSHPTAVYWSRMFNNVQKSVWRREKSGLEFRSVKYTPQAFCPVPNFGKGDYSLHISGITDEDGGEYICEVVGTSRMVKGIMLRIIKVSISPAFVVEGSRVKTTCHISPKPQFRGFSLKLNGKSEDRIVLNNVSQRDSGNWTCQVSYKDMAVKATATLQVKGISTPQVDYSLVYAAEGSSAYLSCVFTEGLIPNTVTWQKTSTTNDSSLPLPSSFKQSVGSSVPLLPLNTEVWKEMVEDGDKGIYTCSGMMEGSNGRMQVQRRMQLVVTRVLSSSMSSSTMTLTCHLSNTSQVNSYEWLRVIYGINNTQTVTSVGKSKVLIIKKMSEQDIGEWVCMYYGKDGVLGNATYQFHMTGAVMGKSESNSGNKVAMVMGLGFLFLVIFIILFQMYKNYHRKNKILLYPAMEAIVHEAATERERREQSKARINEACGGDTKSVCV